jgi:lysophospholipase L1-like esterase
VKAGRRSRGEERRPGRARSAAFTVVVTVAALALLEGGLRLAELPPEGSIPLIETPLVIHDDVAGDDWRGWHLFGSQDFEADPVTETDPAASCLWVPRAGRAPFNADGAVGPLRTAPRQSGTLRLLAVGDSNTLADGGRGWVQQVDGALADGLLGCASVEALNAGVHGYGAYQGRLRLQRFLSWTPDVVVIAFGWNDPLPVRGPADARYGRALAEALRLRRAPPLIDRSALFGSLRALVLGMRASGGPEQPRVPLDAFVEHHRAMIAAARDAGAIPVVATRPFVLDPAHEHLAIDVGHEAEVAAYAEALRGLADEDGVLLLDLLAAADGLDRRTDWLDTNHFTEQGHRKAARMLAELLASTGARICDVATDGEGE